ncbi:hypothetical protein ACFQ0M_48380 [Kitasatospora aburaviensis]|uniref:Uncharacterized protein n=1 Tax=Kitasatospora aburaviensis TaxID=67265 RepID=A0ABW1EYN8_9ACTN
MTEPDPHPDQTSKAVTAPTDPMPAAVGQGAWPVMDLAVRDQANALAGFVRDRATEVSRIGNLSLTDTVVSMLMKAAYALGQIDAGLAHGDVELVTRQLNFLIEQADTWRDHPDNPNAAHRAWHRVGTDAS